MNVLFVSSEAAPYAKTGGLGDVVRDLPMALSKRPDLSLRIVMPCYARIRDEYDHRLKYQGSFTTPLAWRRLSVNIFQDCESEIPTYFLEQESYFDRPALYGYYDDAERFAFFSRAVLELAVRWDDWIPDVFHCNDWQTALVPVFLKAFYGYSPLRQAKVLLTVHNAAYQGRAEREFRTQVLGISEAWENTLDLNGEICLLKAGLLTADRVNTVSKTYAQELTDPWFAQGLEGVFQSLGVRFCGIENGIDPTRYDPRTDPALFCNYSGSDLVGKLQNKRYLQKKTGLELADRIPLAAMVTRLADHKGLELVQGIFAQMMDLGLELLVLGTGDAKYETFFHQAQRRYPGRLFVRLDFDPDFAVQVYGGADLFMMPSKNEPCGLAQLIAMRYGAIPLVRQTGGLKDTVPPWEPGSDTGFGFTFYDYNAHELLYALGRALDAYRQPELWQRLVRRAMATDHSWARSVEQYCSLYTALEKEKTA